MTSALRVVVAGGGVAGLETALALRELAGDGVAMTLVAPEPEFVYRPQAVREPFALGAADRYAVADIAADVGAELVADRIGWIDPAARTVHTGAGRVLPYDALMVAVGARQLARHPLALTIDPARLDEQLHGLIQDVEGGHVHSIAFVIPGGSTWVLPAYELALMTARRAEDAQAHLQVTLVTPEDAPLGVFGKGASEGVRQLLDEAGIDLVRAARVQMPSAREVVVPSRTTPIRADRVVALPELHGPTVRGLPAGPHGMIPIDPYCRVRGLEDVWAAGDATDYPIKHGGVSAQQADTAARGIAARAGAPVMPRTLRPSIHAVLMTGERPRALRAQVAGDAGFDSHIEELSGPAPAKIAAEHLGPYLEARAPLPRRPAAAG
jgi:sulfide:quinone oxidoreductase